MNAEIIGVDRRGGPLMLLCYQRVCSDGTEQETLDWLRTTSPAGTSNNWQICNEANKRPVPCADNPNRTHYMFTC